MHGYVISGSKLSRADKIQPTMRTRARVERTLSSFAGRVEVLADRIQSNRSAYCRREIKHAQLIRTQCVVGAASASCFPFDNLAHLQFDIQFIT